MSVRGWQHNLEAGITYTGHQLPLPKYALDEQRARDWPERRKWLRSIGLTDTSIRLYRLDRYPYMTSLAWDCMVREALRGNCNLRQEQYRRKMLKLDQLTERRP